MFVVLWIYISILFLCMWITLVLFLCDGTYWEKNPLAVGFDFIRGGPWHAPSLKIIFRGGPCHAPPLKMIFKNSRRYGPPLKISLYKATFFHLQRTNTRSSWPASHGVQEMQMRRGGFDLVFFADLRLSRLGCAYFDFFYCRSKY